MKRILAVAIAVLALGLSAAPALAGSDATVAGPTSWPPEQSKQVDPSITDGSAKAAFREARNRWLSQRTRNYRFRIAKTCFCLGPGVAVITVRKNRPVKVRPIRNSGEIPGGDNHWWGPRTVAGLFKFIHQSIRQEPATLEVNYARRRGFVRRTWVDQEVNLMDEEIGYSVQWLKELR